MIALSPAFRGSPLTWAGSDVGDVYSSPNYFQNNTGGTYGEHYHRQVQLAADPN